MGRRKEVKLVIDSYGNYLGMEKGCMVLKDRHGTVTRYPIFEAEIGEVILKSGNMISTGLLSSLGFWDRGTGSPWHWQDSPSTPT